jgi:hypothetical protein
MSSLCNIRASRLSGGRAVVEIFSAAHTECQILMRRANTKRLQDQLKLARKARGLAKDQSRLLNRVDLLKKLDSVIIDAVVVRPVAKRI